jgi:DNA-binding XRE family transcriptional regulator
MTGYVYAIADTNGAVKIGYAADPIARVAGLATGHPGVLTLLGMAVGTEAHEAECHRLFRAHRIRGEWFRREGIVETFVGMLPRPPRPQIVTDGMEPVAFIRRAVFQATMPAMARIAGVSQGTISKWENGIHTPNADALGLIRAHARTLGCKWNDDWLFAVPTDVQSPHISPTAAPTSSATQSVG